MLQDNVALTEVIMNLSEQLQQVQSQLAEQQAKITEQQATITDQQKAFAEQARQIHALTKNDVKQARQVARLTDYAARLEAEHRIIASQQDNGTGCCMPALFRPFNNVNKSY